LRAQLTEEGYTENIAYLIGDVRDRERVIMASIGTDIIIHCAAIKRIDTAEENPLECIETNVGGAENIVYAAVRNVVEKVVQISTDKAVYPTTLYGATKKCAEDLMITANTYSGGRDPRFSCIRYGNVFGSNGSVIELFRRQAQFGILTVTDPKMTRFWITVKEVAAFICDRIEDMKGGEIYVPNMPSLSVMDIAKFIAPEAEIKYIGLRGQEKLHEFLITEEESIYTDKRMKHFTIRKASTPTEHRWTFGSGNNPWQLTRDELGKMLEEL